MTPATDQPDCDNTDAAAPTSEDESALAPPPIDAITGCGHHDEDNGDPDDAPPPRCPSGWLRLVSFAVVPTVALLVGIGAAYLKYEEATARQAGRAAVESVQAAKDSTIAILSYAPDTAEAQLGAAGELLTGTFRDSYATLAHDVVIPGSKEKKISATATVPAAASVSATVNHAVVLVFVNQAIVMANDAPTSTTSVVEVTLEKVGNRWLVSGFDPK